MMALKEPRFDLSCDWQAMYANSVMGSKYYDYINNKFGYDLELKNKVTGKLFSMYTADGKDDNFFPHFNGGAFLIREELCEKPSQHMLCRGSTSLCEPNRRHQTLQQRRVSFAWNKIEFPRRQSKFIDN